MQRCATCRFHAGEDCRRHPPRVIVKRGKIAACWPAVEPDEWCGEWRRAETPPNEGAA